MNRLVFILILMSQTVFSQEVDSKSIRNKIEKIVSKIAEENMYNSSAVGFAGERTKQWERFEKLQKKATESELINLTNHPNPVVRSYSFEALANRRSSKTFEILIDHLEDNESMSTFQGCIVSSQLVGDFFLNAVNPKYIPNTAYELKEQEKKLLDSLLMFNPAINLLAQSFFLEEVEPKEMYYEPLKRKYSTNKDGFALIAISKYRKLEDRELIKEWLQKSNVEGQYFGLRAVQNWPDKFFFPYLENIHQQEIKKQGGYNYSLIRMLYLTLVQYKNEESRELILNTLDNAKEFTLEYHSEYIWFALTKYPDEVYEGLKENIKIPDWKKSEFEYQLKEKKDR